jgi:hypothetical protein
LECFQTNSYIGLHQQLENTCIDNGMQKTDDNVVKNTAIHCYRNRTSTSETSLSQQLYAASPYSHDRTVIEGTFLAIASVYPDAAAWTATTLSVVDIGGHVGGGGSSSSSFVPTEPSAATSSY